jgi:mono/diheme cytochrome c family protein
MRHQELHMNRTRAFILAGSAVFIGFTIAATGRQQQPAAGGIFTAAQAQSGQAAYAQQCAGCHGQDFRGSADAPAVESADFRTKWGPRATNELFTYLVQTMPPTNPGVLGEEGTLAMTAFLLQLNVRPRAQPVTPRSGNQISVDRPGGRSAGGEQGAADAVHRADVIRAGTAARPRGLAEHRRDREGRGEELCPCHAGNAEESASWRNHLPP